MKTTYTDKPFAFPGTPVRYAPDRSVDHQHVLLEMEVDLEARTLTGRATHRFLSLRDGLEHLVLDAEEMEILKVRASGEDLSFHHDGQRLTVDLPEPMERRQEGEVAVTYRVVEPRRGFYFVGPDEGYPERPLCAWSQGQDQDSRFWWPGYDYPNERASTEMIVTVPEGYFALSNGELVSRTPSGDGRETFHWRQALPHVAYLVTLVVGRFAVIEDEAAPESGPPVPLATYVTPAREEEARRATAETGEMIRLFVRKTGVPYPWEKYAQVFVPEFTFGGMENTSATTLTEDALRDERAALDTTAEDLVSHELAHMWFGDLVTCRDWSQAWLNEGFATYMEVIWKEHRHGWDEACWHLAEYGDTYRKEARSNYVRPILSRTWDAPIDLFDAHLYLKGAWVLHALRHALGDEDFWVSVRRYVDDHREEGLVEIDDLRRAVQKVTGRNMESFFDQWVKGAGHPSLEIEARWMPEDGELHLSVRQTQEGEAVAGAFVIETDVAVAHEEGWDRHAVRIDRREQSLSLPLESPPLAVAFDPDQTFLHDLSFKRPTGWLVRQLRQGPTAWARAEAAGGLGGNGSREAVGALRESLLNGTEFWGVRAAAAAALGKVSGGASIASLAEGLEVDHPKVRRAVAGALGEHAGEASFEALASLFRKGDPSCMVEAEVAHAAGRTRSGEAWSLLSSALERPSWNEVIRAGALDGMAALGDPRGVDAALEWTEYGNHHRVRVAASSVLGRMGWVDTGARRRIRLRLEELIHDPNYRVRLAATEALGNLGEPEGSAALSRLAGTTRDGRTRRKAREALRAITEGGAAARSVLELQGSLDQARRQIADLRRRVESLEKPGGNS